MGADVRGPDHRLAIEKYRRLASRYDRRTALAVPYRRRAVKLLSLPPSGSVLDVACGTGISFPLLERHVGPGGRIIGVDVSAEMLAHARERARREGWSNVTLIEGNVEDADLGGPFDAALFSLTHDVLQSRAAVEKVVNCLLPGGRVAAFGGKRAPGWRFPVNIAVGLISRRYVTTLENLERPWAELEWLLPGLDVTPVALGGAYIAWGKKEDPDPGGAR